MSLQVELYRSDDYLRYGELAMRPLLRAFFEPLIGEPLVDARFRLTFLPLPDSRVLDGPPTVVNLRSSHGFVQVLIEREGRVLYRHPHPVREIIGLPLQQILAAREPAETHWGFGVGGPAMQKVELVRPAPEVAHSVSVRSGAGRGRVFQLEEIAPPDPPLASLADLGADVSAAAGGPGARADGTVQVVLPQLVRDGFMAGTPFSDQVEEGGFLTGQVFRDPARDGGFLVEISEAIRAERTGASMLNFTFTGESFLRISELISARQHGEQLLGWYHTHLFPATDAIGLSSVDVELHQSTFRRPWQVAALVNLTDDGRVLRFYRSDGAAMARAPYWVVRR